MATVTRTYTENASNSYKATWTVTTAKSDFTVNSSTFTLSTPTCTAKYVYAGKNFGDVTIHAYVTIGGSSKLSFSYSEYRSMTSGTTYTCSPINVIQSTIDTSDIWNSGNPNTKTVPLYFHYSYIYLGSEKIVNDLSTQKNWIQSSTDTNWQICTATLNAPPTLSLGTPTYSTPHYAGLGTYSVPITQAKAQYGGNVTKITLTVGSETVTQTYSSTTVSNKTISLTPSTAGTFTPTIKVTDSRGQTKTQSLSSITVSAYSAPSMSFGISRCNSSGVLQAEGEHGLITAKISYIDALAHLTQPTVTVKDENGTAVTSSATWYETWDAVNGVSDAVNWTNYQPTSPVTLYAVLSATGGTYSINETYTVSITPTDDQGGVAQTITQTLPTGFFTIDFQAGGKEIAFGGLAYDDLTNYPDGLFKCDMDAVFNNDVTADLFNAYATTIDKDAQTVTTNITEPVIYSRDVNNKVIGRLYSTMNTSKTISFIFGAYRTVGGTNYSNNITSSIADDGTRNWSFSDATAFRTGLGISDHVTSQSTSGTWKYRRWSSGIDECWYSENPGAYTCGTARGNMYAGGWLSYTFPITFGSAPTVTASAELATDAYVVLAQVRDVTTTGCKVRIVSGSSIAQSSNYVIKIYAIGV